MKGSILANEQEFQKLKESKRLGQEMKQHQLSEISEAEWALADERLRVISGNIPGKSSNRRSLESYNFEI